MNLPRVLEPEIMDTAADALHYDQMNHSLVNQGFVDDLVDLLRTNTEFAIRLEGQTDAWIDLLDVGTANALVPVQLCQQYGAFRVMAIDMATSMLELANYHVQASSVSQRIQLARVDAKAMTYDTGMFDVVTCKSTIHHIPDPDVCLAEIVRVCKPGGAVFIRDLMRPQDETTLEKIVQTYAGKETEYSQRLYRESLHAALTLAEVQAIVEDLGWDPEDVKATSDRHWTWATIDH